MYKEILFALGGNAALLVAVSWLIKSVLTHFLSKDIEIYKQTLKAESDKAFIEHDIIFRSLHAKRADVIANLHSQLIEVGKCLNSICSNIRDQKARGLSPKISAEASGQLVKYLIPSWDYFNTNKLYFSLNLSNKISSLLISCFVAGVLTTVTQEQDLSSIPVDFQKKLQDSDEADMLERLSEITDEFNATIKEIENTFRSIIGITV